jgi:hypothetical protein
LLRTKDYSSVSKITKHDHLTDDNWDEWKERMKQVFRNCGITGYVDGTTKKPSAVQDSYGAGTWDRNDSWAQQVIIQNVTSSQLTHVGSMESAEAMYSTLTVMHENKAHGTVHHVQCLLYETKASDGGDIIKHLDTLKAYRDRINKFPHPDFNISDIRFKSIISGSLPSSWQTFVEPYNSNANDPNDPDPK